jgi:uncharacterized membrane protein YkoI
MKLASMAILGASLSGCIVHTHQSKTHDMTASEVVVIERKTKMTPATLAESCKVALGDAIDTALAKVPGKALSAEAEFDDGKAVYEVMILSDGKMVEVEIDATTGAILEVEQEDDEDDDEDDMDDEDDD